jgi:hypothetical protein
MIRIFNTYIASSFLKHLYHSRVRLYIRGSNRYIRFSSKTTRFDVFLIVLFLVGNVICFNIRIKDVLNLIKRFSLLCIINLMPLALREHMNLVASFYGIKLNVYANMYEWLRRVVIIKGFIYFIAAISS